MNTKSCVRIFYRTEDLNSVDSVRCQANLFSAEEIALIYLDPVSSYFTCLGRINKMLSVLYIGHLPTESTAHSFRQIDYAFYGRISSARVLQSIYIYHIVKWPKITLVIVNLLRVICSVCVSIISYRFLWYLFSTTQLLSMNRTWLRKGERYTKFVICGSVNYIIRRCRRSWSAETS